MYFVINKLCFICYSRYTGDEFPQLFGGPIDMEEYQLALHLLQNQNVFTVHEVAVMLKGSTEENFEYVQFYLYNLIMFKLNKLI